MGSCKPQVQPGDACISCGDVLLYERFRVTAAPASFVVRAVDRRSRAVLQRAAPLACRAETSMRRPQVDHEAHARRRPVAGTSQPRHGLVSCVAPSLGGGQGWHRRDGGSAHLRPFLASGRAVR